MRRLGLLLPGLAACGVLTACGGEASGSDVSVVTPNPSITAQPATDPSFHCTPLLPAVQTTSEVAFEGPCAFPYVAPAKCVKRTVDHDTNVQLPLQGGGTLDLDVDLEHFKGAGTYSTTAQVVLTVSRSGHMWSWQDLNGTAVLSQDEKSVTIPPIALPAAPDNAAGGTETVRGTLVCG